MIEYRCMDGSLVLPICLHGGIVPLSRLPELAERTGFEDEFELEPGVHARLLRALGHRYGATGLVALDGDRIVGLLRFYPRALKGAIGRLCPQDEPYARRLAGLDVAGLPETGDLQPRSIQIDCLQVIPEYRWQGIGHTLIERTIAWARENDWHEIYATGMQHILPLMSWSGQVSAQSLQKQGFQVIGQDLDPEIREAAVSQQLGYHGEEVQRMWQEQYAHVSAEEAAICYELKLTLERTM
jgi:GNAT superfamily N-acetyltransferase